MARNQYSGETLEQSKIRFIEKILIGDGCWNWTGAKNSPGYGYFSLKGRQERANRISFKFFKGEIPEGKFICHTCDNPACVRPSHLFYGSQSENIKDAYRKGRIRSDGEFSRTAKLKTADVLTMRNLYSSGKFNKTELAKIFSITQSHACTIINRKQWKFV